MSKTEFHHDIVAKVEWFFYLVFGLIGVGFIAYCLSLTAHFWGEWQAGTYIISALLALVPTCLAIYMVLRRVCVWSQIIIEENFIIQRLLSRERKIDLSCPFEKSYIFVLLHTSELHQPTYQWLELRQGKDVIYLMPRRLVPKVSPDTLPERLREIWQEYSIKTSFHA